MKSHSRRKYTHLLPREVVLWEKFLAAYKDRYMSFEYDVHVGPVWEEIQGMPPAYRKGGEAIYKKRIDVVAHQPGIMTIFEIKPHAGMGILGQILGYLELYETEFSPGEDLQGAIITGLVDPAVRTLLEDHGIEIYEYREE